MRFDLITGLVMSGKTEYIIKVMRLLQPDNFITVVSNIVGDSENFKIKSRAEGFDDEIKPDFIIGKDENLYERISKILGNSKINTIIVDEVQFLETHHIDELINIAKKYKVHVICSGISHTFKHEMWNTIKYILLQDEIYVKTLKVKCYKCHNIAERNKKVAGNLDSGDIEINGGEGDKYYPACFECWAN